MAAVGTQWSRAARCILTNGDGSNETETQDDTVQSILRSFYALSELTPATAIPKEVSDRIIGKLVQGGSEPADPVAANRPTAGARGKPGLGGKKRNRAAIRVPLIPLILFVLALILSLAANFLMSRSDGFRPERAIYLTGTDSAPQSRGVVLADGSSSVLHATGLAELSAGYRYVAWDVAGPDARYLGSLTMLDSASARLVALGTSLPSAIVVTIEPSAAPGEPTGPQVLAGIDLR